MILPKENDTGIVSHGQPSQKRKHRTVNDENGNSQARSQKANNRIVVVLEDIRNISHVKNNELGLHIPSTKRNRLHRDEGSIGLRMLKSMLRQNGRNQISNYSQGTIESNQHNKSSSFSNIRNDPTPNSIFKKPPSNQSIPLKSIFGRIFKDISNIPQSCDRPQSGGFGSQAVQMPHISSPRFGKLSQTPYVAATSMGYCKSKRLKNLQCPTPTRNKFARWKISSHKASLGSFKLGTICLKFASSTSHLRSTGINSKRLNSQPNRGYFIKLLLSTYFMFPIWPLHSARSQNQFHY
ncbi:hypothetical protein F2Q69_00052795 [Brassica cretica]|uniref:Uncharacterized protein n=1 Tax=Brassica cretica TaxID=69181 RepID=A0A8S9MXA2_BRACR|nr:hypothetical protein F2Q69_00052795 [Brassica cretica]